MCFYFESRETVSYLSTQVRHIASHFASGNGIENISNDSECNLGGLRLLLRCDISNIVDEDEGVIEQFLSGIGQRSQSPCGLQRYSNVNIAGVVLAARLNEFGIESSILG